MFDSAPQNLPIENPPAGQALPSASPQPPQGMINETGIKEPEDIFAGINDAENEPQKTVGPIPMRPVSSSFPWKIMFGIGIPVVIIGLGLGGWYVYSSYKTATKPLNLPAKQTGTNQNVPLQAATNKAPEPSIPVPVPDETKVAANQATLARMQAQGPDYGAQNMTSTLPYPTATSTTGIQQPGGAQTPTSTQAPSPSEVNGTAPEENAPSTVPPPNIPPPTLGQSTISKSSAAQSVTISRTGSDSDNDGLTNSEEALLGSNPNKSDTNGNGYPDGTEVKNGYDPVLAGSKIYNSKFLKIESIGVLQVMIPTAWVSKPSAAGTVQILTGTPAVITVDLKPFAIQKSLLDWVTNENEGTTGQDYVTDKTAMGADVVYSKDGMTAWILVENTVYQFRYGTNGAASLDFGNIFKYIIIKQAHVKAP